MSIAAVASVLAVAPAHGLLAIRLGSASGTPGATVSVDVVLNTDRGDVSGLANTISLAAPLYLRRCDGNPEIQQSVYFGLQPQGCETQQLCSSVRAIVLAFEIVPPLPDGAMLYHCEVGIAADAAVGTYPLACSAAEAGNQAAEELPAECINGAIEVVVPTTPSPTATPVRAPCDGDLDGNRTVSISELVRAVRSALDGCP